MAVFSYDISKVHTQKRHISYQRLKMIVCVLMHHICWRYYIFYDKKQGISEPVSYGVLVFRFKRMVGKPILVINSKR